MKNLIIVVSIIFCSCQNAENRQVEEMTKEQACAILEKYGLDYEEMNIESMTGQISIPTIKEFEEHIKYLAKIRDEQESKIPKKDYILTYQELKTDQDRVDSLKKWIKTGNFQYSISNLNKTKCGGKSKVVPFDSVEYYYYKMKNLREKKLTSPK